MSAGERPHANGRRNIDHVLVGLIASGATMRKAAEATSTSVSTVRRRCQDPRFRVAVEAERHLMMETVRGQLADASTNAVATLLDVAMNGRTEAARVSASRAILDLSVGRRSDVIELAQVNEIFNRIVGMALDRLQPLSPEQAEEYFLDVEVLLTGAGR